MKILDTVINKGKQSIVKLPVGQLPSGTRISICAHVYRAKQRGPCMLIVGGVHGDEINGVEIVRDAIKKGLFSDLKRGSVIAIPVLNVYGFINFSREVPDGKDVNRSFPGTAKGSLASRVAFALHKNILPFVDFGIDFHTGGRSNFNLPQIRFTKGDKEAEKLALTFGAPLTLPYVAIRKSLRKIAFDKHQARMLVFEGGENLRYDKNSIDIGLGGIERLLAAHGMIDAVFEDQDSMQFSKSKWVRASVGGVFQWIKSSGESVEKGEKIGFINDPQAIKSTRYLLAPVDGFIFGHNNTPVVSQGDALFHIAFNE